MSDGNAQASAPETGVAQNNLGLMLDIELPLTVRFGRTRLSLRALSTVSPGWILDMGRSPEDPVEVLIGDRVIAHADVVVVNGNYGVRILDLLSPLDRVRALEA